MPFPEIDLPVTRFCHAAHPGMVESVMALDKEFQVVGIMCARPIAVSDTVALLASQIRQAPLPVLCLSLSLRRWCAVDVHVHGASKHERGVHAGRYLLAAGIEDTACRTAPQKTYAAAP